MVNTFLIFWPINLTSGSLTNKSWTLFGSWGKLYSANVFRQFMYLSWIGSNSLSWTLPRIEFIYFMNLASSCISLPSGVVTIATTFRQTYSCMVSLKFLKVEMTCVIFSTMGPTSCLNWSMVMGLPIMEVRHVWRVTKFVATCQVQNICFHLL